MACVHELEHCSCSYAPTPAPPNYGARARLAQAKLASPRTRQNVSLVMGTKLERDEPNRPGTRKPPMVEPSPAEIAERRRTKARAPQKATLAALQALL